MRPEIKVIDQLNRDTSWITQDLIERYVAARMQSEEYGNRVLGEYCINNPARYKLFQEIIVSKVEELHELELALIDEFGEESFYKRKTKSQMLAHMHSRLETEPDNEIAAKLFDSICKAEGWHPKQIDGPQTVVDITNINGAVKFDKSNPAEAEKLYMAIAGAAIVR